MGVIYTSPMGPGFFIFFRKYRPEPRPRPEQGRDARSGGDGGYRDFHKDVQRESDLARIKREDEELIEFIVSVTTKGIL